MSVHEEIKKKARKSLEDLIKKGVDSKKALKQVQAEYMQGIVEIMANEINSLKIGFVTPTKLKDMAIGGLDLSNVLYKNSEKVSKNVLKVVNEHAKELNNAKELALKIYEGYDFKEDHLKVAKSLPKYLSDTMGKYNARMIKTPAVRAAYMKVFEAENEKQLHKALEVAMYERNRYFANRIAQTELHRVKTQQKAKEILEDEGIEVVQIRLSPSHPEIDICDYHSGVDLYGLGKGCYPKDKAPLPPYHPFCQCRVVPRLDLMLSDAKQISENPERELMNSFSEKDQVKIIGGKGLHEKWKRQGDLTGLVDSTKKPLYQLRLSESVLQKQSPITDLDGNDLLEERIIFNPKDLSDIEKRSLLHWTMSSNGFKFNIANRKNHPFHLSENQLDLDEFNITRDGHQQAFEDLFSKYKGENSDTLYRGVVIQSSDSEYAKSFDALKAGDIVQDVLPNSYSKSFDKGVHFANLSNADAHRHIVYELKGANTGNRFDIESLSDMPEEREVLVSGIKYKIIAIEKKEYTDRWGDTDKYTHVTIEEVE